MVALTVRPGRPGDGPGIAQAWVDCGRYYTELFPDLFQIPTSTDIARHFDDSLPSEPGGCRLVAEIDGAVVGYAAATFRPASVEPDSMFDRDALSPSVWLDALIVQDAARAQGVGGALVTAVEEWAREQGATTIDLDTFARSPVSVPFYEHRGYERRAIRFRKRL